MDEDELSDLRNRKIGFVFQGFNLVPRTSALANVELPLSYAGLPRVSAARALAALDAVGLGARVDHLPSSCRAASSSGSPWRAPSSPTPR